MQAPCHIAGPPSYLLPEQTGCISRPLNQPISNLGSIKIKEYCMQIGEANPFTPNPKLHRKPTPCSAAGTLHAKSRGVITEPSFLRALSKFLPQGQGHLLLDFCGWLPASSNSCLREGVGKTAPAPQCCHGRPKDCQADGGQALWLTSSAEAACSPLRFADPFDDTKSGLSRQCSQVFKEGAYQVEA